MTSRVMIAAVRSGSGKTSIATGLMGALVRSGSQVQGFKVGPDFIDPSYHTAVTGRSSRNLDTWMVSYSQVRQFFWKAAATAEIAVIEGVMGLFDGLQGTREQASSAEVAKLLGCPVLLVLDVHSQARSAVVEYLGCQALDPDLPLAGVILNRVQGPRHLEMLQACFADLGIPVLGAITNNSLPHLSERHLGLVPVPERKVADLELQSLIDAVAEQLDLDRIWQIANSAPDVFHSHLRERFSSRKIRLQQRSHSVPTNQQTTPAGGLVRVAYAWDEAFNFYYRDGLDLLEEMGVQLVPFSAVHDTSLPAGVSGVLIGGGFPELFASELAANEGIKESLRQAHRQGMPIYAECGGFMYLCQRVSDLKGVDHQMVGLVPGSCQMEKKLAGMGYITAHTLRSNLFCAADETLRGHQFHYSTFTPAMDVFPWAFEFIKGNGNSRLDGYAEGNLLASYLHLHFAAAPRAAARFASACREWHCTSEKVGVKLKQT